MKSAGGANHSGYNDPEFNELFDAAKAASSYEEAGELYAQAAQKVNEDVPAYILGHGNDYVATSAAILNGDEYLGGWGNQIRFIKKAA